WQNVESGFMPNMDEGALMLDYEMPAGTSLDQTGKVLARIEDVLDHMPDIAGYIRRTGAENGLFVTESFRGDILVSLKPPSERRSMNEVRSLLDQQIHDVAPEMVSLELTALIQDQLNDLAGLEGAIEIEEFGPRPRGLR